MAKNYALPKQSTKLKDLLRAPMPDLAVLKAATQKKVQARRDLEDRLFERKLTARGGDL
jgi:hypothetical protein